MERVAPSDALIEDLADGRRRVHWSGRCVPYQLNTDDRRRFERAKRVGFLVDRRRPNALNCYRLWCSAHPRPLVTVRPGRRSSDVFVEMTFAGWGLTRDSLARIDSLRDSCDPACMLHAWECLTDHYHPHCRVNFDVGRRVNNVRAETVAFRLWEIANDCRPVGSAR